MAESPTVTQDNLESPLKTLGFDSAPTPIEPVLTSYQLDHPVNSGQINIQNDKKKPFTSKLITKKISLLSIVILILIFMIGFIGAMVYNNIYIPLVVTNNRRHIPIKSIPNTIGTRNITTPDSAIFAVQYAYPQFQNIKRSTIDGSSSIRIRQTSKGWKLQFVKGSDCMSLYAIISNEIDGCAHEIRNIFFVAYDGTVEKVGEYEYSFDVKTQEATNTDEHLLQYFNED